MKKIINKITLLSIGLFIASCGTQEKKNEQDTPDIAAPQAIVGIGKVVPQDGIVMLSVTQSNKVTRIHKGLGDTVRRGDILFEMEAIDEELNLNRSQSTLRTAEANAKVNEYDIKRAEIKLAELKKEYETSRRLYEKNAETAQKLTKDSVAYFDQLALIQQYRQQLNVQHAMVNERQADVRINSNKVAQQYFKVLQEGVITRLDISLGEVLTPNNTFGELASLSDLVIEGELDEFYATQLQLGQQVEITLVGQSTVIAKGTISYVGAGLQNKSILYETRAEASDRRVRRFTVKITENMNALLINQKVECKILL